MNGEHVRCDEGNGTSEDDADTNGLIHLCTNNLSVPVSPTTPLTTHIVNNICYADVPHDRRSQIISIGSKLEK